MAFVLSLFLVRSDLGDRDQIMIYIDSGSWKEFVLLVNFSSNESARVPESPNENHLSTPL